MIYAVMKTMALRLWRDKGALLLAFILPGFIFAIFAVIFSTASGGTLDLRVALGAETDNPVVAQTLERIKDNATFDILLDESGQMETVRETVRLGQADVGLFIGSNPDISTVPALPRLTILQDPSREVAGTVIKGQIRQILAAETDQSSDIFVTQSAMPEKTLEGATDKSVTYYIGATAILFLMFASMQGASISIDERRSGISQRLMVGPKGALAMLTGKFLFLTQIGFIQTFIIIAVAALFFDVEVTRHIPALILITLGTAMLSASLALFIAALCGSASQMHTVSTFLVLLFSAIGGSMVPRFMMPDWLQGLGILTPNYWVIEGFYGILARGQSVLSLWPVLSVIYVSAGVFLASAAIISHKMMRL
jgi:ABC-2 type transport system permease protein